MKYQNILKWGKDTLDFLRRLIFRTETQVHTHTCIYMLGRGPGLQQASLPFHASLCPNVHPQLVGHPRRQSWVCPAPHGSEGPSKSGALPSSCDVLVPLLSPLGMGAPAVGWKFLGLTSGAARFTRNHAVCHVLLNPHPHPHPLRPASSQHQRCSLSAA